ncbi:hypothetical protein [Flavobacterium pedocola]
MKSIYMLLAASLLLTGCADFSKKMVKNNAAQLSEINFKSIEGNYHFFPDIEYDKKGVADTLKSKILINDFSDNVDIKWVQLDTLSEYSIETKVVSLEKVRFVFKRNNEKINIFYFMGILKEDGFFYLDNEYKKCWGVPLLCGGCTSRKTRIGIAKDGGLLMNTYYDSYGGFMLIFSNGSSYNTVYHYKRIQKQ